MSNKDNGATRLPSYKANRINEPRHPRRVLSSHDYGRLEITAFEEIDMLNPMRQWIAHLLSVAQILHSDEMPEDVITLGTTVRYRIDGDVQQRRLLTLGHQQVPNGQYVSVLTPVGLALIGRKPGETVEAEVFDGRKLRIEISALENQPEAEARARMTQGRTDDGPEAA